LSLCQSSRKSVQHVPVFTIILSRPLLNYPDDKIIRGQPARGLQGANLFRQLIAGFSTRAQDIASRNLRKFESLLKQTRLRTFASTRRTHQDYDFRHTDFRS